MESRGDCRAASPVSSHVADGADRALAARALVYLGVCHERLGRADAASTYRRVIERFPEQRAAVTEARRRLPHSNLRPEPGPYPRRPSADVARHRPDAHRAGAASAGGCTFAKVSRVGHVVLGHPR